jgi:hypothetical protein
MPRKWIAEEVSPASEAAEQVVLGLRDQVAASMQRTDWEVVPLAAEDSTAQAPQALQMLHRSMTVSRRRAILALS